MIISLILTCCSSLFKCIILDFRTLAFFPKIDLFFVVLIRDTFDFRDLPFEEPYMEFFLLSADFLYFRGFRWSELKTTFFTENPQSLVNADFCRAISFIFFFMSFCFLSAILRSSSSFCFCIFFKRAIFFRKTRFGE